MYNHNNHGKKSTQIENDIKYKFIWVKSNSQKTVLKGQS